MNTQLKRTIQSERIVELFHSLLLQANVSDKVVKYVINRSTVNQVAAILGQKVKTDKHAPKKPSAYRLFCDDHTAKVTAKIKKQFPDLKKGFVGKVSAELGVMWKNISDKQKAKYEQKAADIKASFDGEFKEYVTTDKFKEWKKEAVETKPRVSREKKPHGANEPKRPPTAYIVWSKQVRDKEGKKTGLTGRELTTHLGQQWKTMSEKKNPKKKLMLEAKQAMEQYKKDMDEYMKTDEYQELKEQIDAWNIAHPRKPRTGSKSAHVIFCNLYKPKLAEEFPDAEKKDLLAMARQKWKSLTKEQKEPYVKMAKETPTKEEDSDFEEKKVSKKPKTAYNRFLEAYKIEHADDGLTKSALHTKAIEAWKTASAEEKEPFETEYKQDKAEKERQEKSENDADNDDAENKEDEEDENVFEQDEEDEEDDDEEDDEEDDDDDDDEDEEKKTLELLKQK